MNKGNQEYFRQLFEELQREVHANAVDKGWWEDDRSVGEIISLMHAELSEALEAAREGNSESEKIPGYSHLTEELADVVIRILDYAERENLQLFGAILEKHEYNKNRSYKHGGKRF